MHADGKCRVQRNIIESNALRVRPFPPHVDIRISQSGNPGGIAAGPSRLVEGERLSFAAAEDAHVPLDQTVFGAGKKADLTRPSQTIDHPDAGGG